MILRQSNNQTPDCEWLLRAKILDFKSGRAADLLAGLADQLLSDWPALWDTDSDDAHNMDIIA